MYRGSGLKARSAGLKLKHFACSAGRHQKERRNPEKVGLRYKWWDFFLRDNLTSALLGRNAGGDKSASRGWDKPWWCHVWASEVWLNESVMQRKNEEQNWTRIPYPNYICRCFIEETSVLGHCVNCQDLPTGTNCFQPSEGDAGGRVKVCSAMLRKTSLSNVLESSTQHISLYLLFFLVFFLKKTKKKRPNSRCILHN